MEKTTKRVLISTPCLDQKVDAYFVHSLCESIKLGMDNDIDIRCIFLANESILPMARNELINLAYKDKYDAMVFIDDDEYWTAQVLIDIVKSNKDVITVPVVNKGDKEPLTYNIWIPKDIEKDSADGYFKVQKTGTGFLKMSRKVVEDLWTTNAELEFRGKKLRNICEYGSLNGGFVGEDITLSRKILELGYDIWVNPHYTVSHIGNKMYKGDFKQQNKL
jgi:hypothetical protein